MKRFVVLFFALCWVGVLSAPVFASSASSGQYTTDNSYWHWLHQFNSTKLTNALNDIVGTNFEGSLISYLISDVCPKAGNGKHTASKFTGVSDDGHLVCVCDACGQQFTSSTLAGSVYDEYVEEDLPVSAIDSEGKLFWYPTYDDLVPAFLDDCYFYAGYSESLSSYCSSGRTFSFISSYGSRTTSSRYYFGMSTLDFVAPIAGFYTEVSSLACSFEYFSSTTAGKGSRHSGQVFYSGSGSGFFRVDDFVSALGVTKDFYTTLASVSAVYYFPIFSIEPYTPVVDNSASAYRDEFRPSSSIYASGADGAYGIINGDGNVQSVSAIFSEDTNTYINSVTGDTFDVSNWRYDYSDRSYNLTLDNGESVTVTYGDSNITVNDAGTTYNVYYLSEGGSGVPVGGSVGSDGHVHSYASSVTVAPTCVAAGTRLYSCTQCDASYTEVIPATGHSYAASVAVEPTCVTTGVRRYTCSACGDTYTRSIPATGHTWELVSSVPTQYNDTGQLVQAGYTLYKCSVCGEQYKIDADVGGTLLPSPSEGGVTVIDGTGSEVSGDVGKGFLSTVAGGLLSDLPHVISLFVAWFTELPALFDGFSAFLRASFSWLPEDAVMLLLYGVGMVVAVGVIKAVWR